MEPVFIEGIGVVSAAGRGIANLRKALKEGGVKPVVNAHGRPAFRIPQDALADRALHKQLKRADRFSRLAVIAAYDALHDAGDHAGEDNQPVTGLIITTAFGAHATIFKFLDDIIDFGETKVSPTTFAHSVHNAAASYIAGTLGCQGQVVTTTQFNFPFHHALMLAYSWLDQQQVDRVLVGTVDECSPAMEYIYQDKLGCAGKSRSALPANPDCSKVIPGEGSIFFLLSRDRARGKYGFFSDMDMNRPAKGWDDTDLSILGVSLMSGSEKAYADFMKKETPQASYSALYGGLMGGSAFDCAVSALMLKEQEKYASAAFDEMADWRCDEKAKNRPLSRIQCVARKNDGQRVFLKMEKS